MHLYSVTIVEIPPVLAGAKPSAGWVRPPEEHFFLRTNRNQESTGTKRRSTPAGGERRI